MPNGGPDCCNDCMFLKGDKRVQKIDDKDRIVPVGQCVLRKTLIRKPYETFCASFMHWRRPKSKGSIFGISFVSYPKHLPWHGNIQPELCSPSLCCVCKEGSKQGIQITIGENILQFCSERHYVQWWNDKHADEDVHFDPENFSSEFLE